jgi:hypothetical protein
MTFLQRKNKGVFLFRTFFVAGLLLAGALTSFMVVRVCEKWYN